MTVVAVTPAAYVNRILDASFNAADNRDSVAFIHRVPVAFSDSSSVSINNTVTICLTDVPATLAFAGGSGRTAHYLQQPLNVTHGHWRNNDFMSASLLNKPLIAQPISRLYPESHRRYLA